MPEELDANNGLARFSFHAWEDGASEPPPTTPTRGILAAPDAEGVGLDPETAARAFLDEAMERSSLPSVAAPVTGAPASRFTTISTETMPLTGTHMVKFRQTLHGIPVYGSFTVVELGDGNELVSIDSTLGEPDAVDPVADLSPARALEIVREAPGGYQPLVERIVPRLHFYFDQPAGRWRLVYMLEDVPVTLRDGGARSGTDEAPPEPPRVLDYVVDAHDGSLVALLPRTPSMAIAGEEQTAPDSFGRTRTFLAERDGDRLVLHDPVHAVETFDFGFADPTVEAHNLPGSVIANPPEWTTAAVSAHANAAAVSQFLRNVLLRNNIDGRGGAMISTINAVVQDASPGPKQWANAFWNGQQMVYGQVAHGEELRSLSANVDVVGHEIFHGVTDSSARLEYRFQSGALNESYSDVFGTIIANQGNDDPRTWDWLLGERLLPGREAFRDMADPTRFDQPAHMDDYRDLPGTREGDWGGVHINSGIPNKAAFTLLTTEDPDGNLALTVREVAAIYYIALTQRLSRTSQFIDSRRAVVASARSMFRGLTAEERQRKVAAVEASFDAVGM